MNQINLNGWHLNSDAWSCPLPFHFNKAYHLVRYSDTHFSDITQAMSNYRIQSQYLHKAITCYATNVQLFKFKLPKR